MNELLLLTGIVIMLCILTDRFTDRLGIPSLLAFIALGMCFGVDGIFKIPFDDYEASEMICSVSLVFIMFYGGFGTNIKEAKPVIARSVVLSTAGVVLTAGLTGLFIHFVLGLSLLESLLTASVIGSTDAASVFGILRSKNLNLKEHTASLLEMESGSNDPISYMLTVILTGLLTGASIRVPEYSSRLPSAVPGPVGRPVPAGRCRRARTGLRLLRPSDAGSGRGPAAGPVPAIPVPSGVCPA